MIAFGVVCLEFCAVGPAGAVCPGPEAAGRLWRHHSAPRQARASPHPNDKGEPLLVGGHNRQVGLPS